MLTEQVIVYFKEKLGLDVYLSDNEMIMFFASLSGYLSHSRTGNSSGRTFGTIKKNLDDLYDFLRKIGCKEREIITILENSFDMLNVEVKKLYNKYLLLGVIKDCESDPDFRKKMIITRPRDFRVSLEMVYARYMFAISVGYPEAKINWSMLMHDTNSEFAKKFVKNAYYKPYKIFESTSDCTPEWLLNNFPIDDNFINSLKDLEVNKGIVMQFEQEQPRM